MPPASLKKIVTFCDSLLNTAQFADWPGAQNGLQIENSGKVKKVVAVVDASLATVRMAAAADANLILAHHGLFWGPSHPWTGKRYELLRLLLDRDIALYSSHLPLDAHPRIGNNVLLCRALGFKKLEPFFLSKGQMIGWKTQLKISRAELGTRLTNVLDKAPVILPGGGEQCWRIGVVTGGAGDELKVASDESVDTFITGEGRHWTYALAEDLGLNVFYGGHYATETFGVKALAAEISRQFKVPWEFLDHPSGL
ncbi:MAG: putative cyclohydrolase 1 type 2 [Verrucomicrobiales bacterium]|nr:putative cyclohydrolase 1 type 2 [Verrucomicrobiales bacterium]